MSDGDALTEARFWEQVLVDGHRTVYCPPEWESRCKGYVAARGLVGMVTVVAHPYVPNGQLLVVDDQAMEAGDRQRAQRADFVAFDAAQAWVEVQERLLNAAGVGLEGLGRIKEGLLRLGEGCDGEE